MPSPRRRKSALPSPAQTNFADLLTDSHGLAGEVREALPMVPAPPPAVVSPFAEFAGLVPVYAVKLVKTGSISLHEPLRIRAPRDVVNLLYQHFEGLDREIFAAVMLNTKGGVIGVSTISVGDLNSAIVHPREVFKPIILCNAASVIFAHNHPSGDPNPSPEDAAVTRRLAAAGELLGIEVLDHVVIGDHTRLWVSLTEKGIHKPTSAGASKLENAP